MKNNFVSLAKLKAKSDKKEKLREELLKLINPTRSEAGCIEYTLFEDKNESGTFYMREAFENRIAFEAHTATAHFQNFASQINDLMDEPIRLIELQQISH